jgi:hypothetical protein
MRSLLLILLLLTSHATAAPPALTSLFPAGGQRGTTVETTATGTFDSWPVKAWANNPFLEVTAAKEKGKLKVAIKPDAPPGVYRIRVSDDTGASQLRPFLVGLHPDMAEVEPNDEPAKAQKVTGPASIHGKLAKSGDVDCYSIPAKKGETLVASLDAHFPLRSPIDAVLQIVSPENAIVAENHDYRGLDPQVNYTVPADGTYTVRLFAFPATPDSSIKHFGSDLSVYRLTVTAGPFVDSATPLTIQEGKETAFTLHGWNLKATTSRAVPQGTWIEPHECFDITRAGPSKPLAPPFSLTGRLNTPEAIFEVVGKKGQGLEVKLESASLGYSLNPVLTVTGPDGKQVARAEPPKLNGDLETNVVPTIDGTYRFAVRDLARGTGPRYAFRLRVTPFQPKLTASVPTDRFSIVAGKPLDTVVTYTRLRTTDPVEFKVEGLPEGVTAVRVPPAGKDDGKTLTIRWESRGTTARSAPVRIAVRAGNAKCSANAPVPEMDSVTEDFWLTVAPGK